MAAASKGWIDVTVPIRDGMVHWPGDPPVRVTRESDIARGDSSTVSRLELGAHTGTHVDAPGHFILGGSGVDAIDPERLVGPARVVRVDDGAPVVDRAIVDAAAVEPGERILFRTSNSDRAWKTDTDAFLADYCYLTLDAAERLVERGVRTVGIDYLSVAGGTQEQIVATHQALLAAGVCIIEGLNLSAVAPGAYDLVCLPLRLRDGDGAPARVLLRPSAAS